MKHWTTLILSFVCWVGIAQEEALFDAATEHYNAGKYEAAAEKYLQILENGQHSAAMYYNLGNCYYKLNRIAPSIYFYEKALLLDPNDPEIKSNLAYAQNMTLDVIEAIPQSGISKIIDRVTGLLTFDQWSYTAIGLMLLFVTFYIAYYYMRYASRKRLAFVLSLGCLFLAMASVLFAYIQHNQYLKRQPAIIFDTEVAVKSEPNTRSQDAFILHEGTKVQVLEQLNEWKKIALADGSTGWLPQQSLKPIKDF